MAEYIEREAAIKEILEMYEREFPTASGAFDEFATRLVPQTLKNLSAADVAPVVHGRWVFGKDLPDAFGSIFRNRYHLFCSVCKGQAFNRTLDDDPGSDIYSSFCHRCGARMDEGSVKDAAD